MRSRDECNVCVSRKDFVKHPVCKALRQKTPYKPTVGEMESLSIYQKDYTCTYLCHNSKLNLISHTSRLGSLVARASDLRLNGREFDPRPPHYRSVGTGMGDRLRAPIQSR